MINIHEITETTNKTNVCDEILHALPLWFGNESAIVDYAQQVKDMPFFAAYDDERAIGFVAIKIHNPHTAEVCVIGIREPYHRQGIGRHFIEHCERFCRSHDMVYLTVKTLDGSARSDEYARTRRFYEAMGFVPLEVFPLFWDEANPCLFLAKYLK